MSDEAGLRRATEPERRGLVAAFSYNTVAANLVMAVLLIGGLISAFNLTAQIFPTIDPGIISVTVPYPGATPSEVEEGITRRVEEATLGIDGVERVSSTASENLGLVQIELKDRVDEIKVRNDIEAAVDRIADFPPLDAEEADIVVAENVSDVVTLVVASDGGERALREAAEWLEQELLALPEVTLVELLGAREYEIAIEVREEALRRHELSMTQVAAAVRASSLNLSSGEIRTGAGDLLLRTNAKRERGREFGNIVLRSAPDGSILRLADVAVVRDGFADVDLVNQYEGRDSIFVRVQKSEAEDVIEIADAILAHLATLEPPEGVDIAVWEDQTEILAGRLNLLLRNGTLGFALVFLFLVLMLDLRLAFWVAMGVPISFMGAFLLFENLGVNINMVSLFALIMVHRHRGGRRRSGRREHRRRARSRPCSWAPPQRLPGAHGVQFGPVLIGVLTTMAAFAPLMFVTGDVRADPRARLPVVVITVLAMSLDRGLPTSSRRTYPTRQRLGVAGPSTRIQDCHRHRGVKRFRDEHLGHLRWCVGRCGIATSRCSAAWRSSRSPLAMVGERRRSVQLHPRTLEPEAHHRRTYSSRSAHRSRSHARPRPSTWRGGGPRHQRRDRRVALPNGQRHGGRTHRHQRTPPVPMAVGGMSDFRAATSPWCEVQLKIESPHARNRPRQLERAVAGQGRCEVAGAERLSFSSAFSLRRGVHRVRTRAPRRRCPASKPWRTPEARATAGIPGMRRGPRHGQSKANGNTTSNSRPRAKPLA